MTKPTPRTTLNTRVLLAGLLAVAAVASAASAQAQSRVQPYATLGEWNVEFVPADRQRVIPAYCQATKIFGQENALRLVSGGKLYAIDFMGERSQAQGKAGYDVQYWFNQPGPNTNVRRAIANQIKDSEGVDWTRIEEPTDEPGSSDEMMNTQILTIREATGKDQWQYPLDGSNQALKALFDCRDERVLGQPRRAPAPIAQMPAPGQQFIQPSPQFSNAGPQFRQAPPPPMPQFQSAPPIRQASNSAGYCSEYGSLMVGWTNKALQARCPGWPKGHLNRDGHFRWCMVQAPQAVEKAKENWSSRLDGCMASFGGHGGGARPPAPQLPAGNASRHPICSSFAKHAERWDNAAKGQGCRIKNDKDERGYFNWCMNTSDADFRVRSPVAGGFKAGREKECSKQLRRPVRL